MPKKPNTSMGLFDQERYQPVTLNDKRRTVISNMTPATTDGLANIAEAVLSFFHVPSESDIFFKAFITTFAESYNSDWNSETVFGRTDPIYTFKNTQRRITLSFKVPAETISEAYENLGRVQKLAQFLYPNYGNLAGQGDILTLTQSPLVRLKVMNLARNNNGVGTISPGDDPIALEGDVFAGDAATIFRAYSSTNDPSKGVLGVITNMNVVHNIENKDIGVFMTAQNTILPKMIEISIDFACIHESTIGWGEDNYALDRAFPYGAYSEIEDAVDSQTSYSEKLAARRAAETQRQKREQEREDAMARGYDGMFGKKRQRRDAKEMARIEKRKAAGKSKKHDEANYEYLQSALDGQMSKDPDSTSNIQGAYWDAGGGSYDEGIE